MTMVYAYGSYAGQPVNPEALPPASHEEIRREIMEASRRRFEEEQANSLSARIAAMSFWDVIVLMIRRIWDSIKSCFCPCFG